MLVEARRANRRLLQLRARGKRRQDADAGRGDVRVQPRRLVERLGRVVERDVAAVDNRRELRGRNGLHHGNGCGSGLTSCSSSGVARRPTSDAASYSRRPPRNRAACGTSNEHSSGATTFVTTSPSSRTSGDVASTAYASEPARRTRSQRARTRSPGLAPSSGGIELLAMRRGDASRNAAAAARAQTAEDWV